ncbi:recombinase family protein [Aliiroseovarius sp. F47248L]|uniref:recombinase family protein n=1 Tax=Aliiroseovarius sp. F47248L TaxID=2926420 RepID=UPI001FF16060|nr:recombinase family protein [Aliiroseovarius sp. F47248L]MCK0139305.1 recombinase family protein [Aliiroseovarius sp. F47248L]
MAFISYYRVSTNRQGTSGLGLDAQRRAAELFAQQSESHISQEFIEVESGKRRDRPQLHAAIEECRNSGSTLLIAKLDRLARNVHFISGLLESNVKFIAVDMPSADRFMLHVYAAMAEEEGRRISERTKAALKSAKLRGIPLGENAKALPDKNGTRAARFAREVGPSIGTLKSQGLSVREIASMFNTDKLLSYRGGQWHSTTVQRVWTKYISLTSGYTNTPPRQ